MAEVIVGGHHPVGMVGMRSKDQPESMSTSVPVANSSYLQPGSSCSASDLLTPDSAATGPSPNNVSRSVKRSRPQKLSISALPAFEFGGDASSQSNDGNSSTTPTRKTPPVSASGGHRRGVSELVGGDAANPITASASPTKSEGFNLGPPVPTGPPPPSRRGHAHRRSGALSQHDLSMLLTPGSQTSNSSSPHTPAESWPYNALRPDYSRSSSHASSSSVLSENTIATDGLGSTPNRSRVTFSSDPEYIPRPLSTISSETSSSLSTVRPGHSGTNSITSLLSGGTSSPPPSKKLRSDPTLLTEGNPKQQAESPDRLAPDSQRGSHEGHTRTTSLLRPSTAPNENQEEETQRSSRNAKSTPFLPLATLLDDQATASQQSSSDRPVSRYGNHTDMGDRAGLLTTSALPSERPRTSPGPKDSKRPTKGKSWAGLILPRKSKHNQRESQMPESSTPSTEQSPPDSAFSLDDVTFDEDTTCIIENPTSATFPTHPSTVQPHSWATQDFDTAIHDDGPVLDIDAALEPLNRPGSASTHSDHSGGFAFGRRRLHSSGETGGFSGPGMHYHRRAESAPELDFFEQGRLGFVHRTSNPAMSEAIEEEEEDEEAMENIAHTPSEQVQELGVHVVESEPPEHTIRRSRRRLFEHRMDAGASTQSSDKPEPLEVPNVDETRADEEPRFSMVTKSSDESTITPAPSPDSNSPSQALPQFSMPLNTTEITPQSTLSTPKSPHTAPSPDYSKSSFDKSDSLRIHTAHSSITDRTTLNSSRIGDQAIGSVDDVPSLTSSASTMVSGHPTRFSSGGGTTPSVIDPTERSFSLSAAVPARIRSGSSSKRSSLVSLSRLVGNTYNKSKLNIAELAQPDSPEKPEKKRGKRMSRLMFWKTKDRVPST